MCLFGLVTISQQSWSLAKLPVGDCTSWLLPGIAVTDSLLLVAYFIIPFGDILKGIGEDALLSISTLLYATFILNSVHFLMQHSF